LLFLEQLHSIYHRPGRCEILVMENQHSNNGETTWQRLGLCIRVPSIGKYPMKFNSR
jgi:hypothetical protein